MKSKPFLHELGALRDDISNIAVKRALEETAWNWNGQQIAINHTPVRLTVGPRQQQMTLIGTRWFLENCENCKSITHYAGTQRPPVSGPGELAGPNESKR